MKTILAIAATCTLQFATSGTSDAAILLQDDFADGALGTNPGTGSGFTNDLGTGVSWSETSGVARWSSGAITNGGTRAVLRSNDTFAANSGSGTVTVSWTITEWSRGTSSGTSGGAGRIALGISDITDPNATNGANPFDANRDGFYISMSSDADNALGISGAGVAGLVYINDTTKTAVGSSWQWDDNGAGTVGATLFDIGTTGDRDDRQSVDMMASNLTMTLTLGLNSWALSFSTTDSGVTLPGNQSGTFSALGLTNDLSSVYAGVSAQGSHNLLINVDSMSVNIIPEPSSLLLLGMGGLGLLRRRR